MENRSYVFKKLNGTTTVETAGKFGDSLYMHQEGNQATSVQAVSIPNFKQEILIPAKPVDNSTTTEEDDFDYEGYWEELFDRKNRELFYKQLFSKANMRRMERLYTEQQIKEFCDSYINPTLKDKFGKIVNHKLVAPEFIILY